LYYPRIQSDEFPGHDNINNAYVNTA